MGLFAGRYDRDWFNRLPSIEEADSEMRASGKLDLACKSLGPIFVSHNLHTYWGICLLHNHWSLMPNEVPIQLVDQDELGPKLVSSPRMIELWADIEPSVIGVADDGDIVPLEYSNDPEVLEAVKALLQRPKFLTEFSEEIRHQSLQGTFGLTALRGFARDDDELVEDTDHNRQSVVRRYQRGTFPEANLTQTAWSFSPDVITMACKKSCFQKCVVKKPGDPHVKDPHTKVHAPE